MTVCWLLILTFHLNLVGVVCEDNCWRRGSWRGLQVDSDCRLPIYWIPTDALSTTSLFFYRFFSEWTWNLCTWKKNDNCWMMKFLTGLERESLRKVLRSPPAKSSRIMNLQFFKNLNLHFFIINMHLSKFWISTLQDYKLSVCQIYVGMCISFNLSFVFVKIMDQHFSTYEFVCQKIVSVFFIFLFCIRQNNGSTFFDS